MSPKLKILFYMYGFVGPQNACIGLGQALLERGHEICFLANERFGDKFSKYGFKQINLKENEKRIQTVQEGGVTDPIKSFCETMEKSGMFRNLPPIEKLKVLDYLDDVYLDNVDFEPQIKEILKREQPDFIVVDCDIVAPCLINAGIPWAFLFCSNPLAVLWSDDLPPPNSGLPIAGDRRDWKEFLKVGYDIHFGRVVEFQRKLSDQFNYPYIEGQKYIPTSPYLNVYQFPKELDYSDTIQIPATFRRVDSFCRSEAEEFQLPEAFKAKIQPGDKLIYLSLGSMGSCYIPLMKRMVEILSKTKHWYIVSRGQYYDQYELADNMWGQKYLPQTKVLPLVDMAIIHGGNNSFTECFVHGTPVVVMPMWTDQFDNAQRVVEKGYGIRLNPFDFEDDDLLQAIEQTLNNQELKEKYQKASTRIKQDDGKLKVCLDIEQIVSTFASS